MSEAPLEPAGHGRAPGGAGWFVLNAADARWQTGPFGTWTGFGGEGEARFPEVGINLAVLQPGEPASLYHGESAQEDFLVLSGECLLLVDGEERMLRQWDLAHCPRWVEHVLVGAGDGPCVVLLIGARGAVDDVVYPESALAAAHGAAAAGRTESPAEAYAPFADDTDVAFDPAWLGRS